MNIYTIIALALALIAITAVMALGIFSMAKGGEFNKKYGNKLMQARVYIQGAALALLALAYIFAQA